MYKTIGIEYVGIDGVFISIIGVLGITELGISNAINYGLYEPMAKRDIEQANKIIAFFKELYILIGTVTLIIGFVLAFFLKFIITDGTFLFSEVARYYFLVLANAVVGYYLFAYRNAILIANIRGDEINNLRSIVLIVQCILQIVILYRYKSYALYLIVAIIMSVVYSILCASRARILYPEYYADGKLSRKERRIILKNVKALFIQRLGNTVWNSADSIVISTFLGLRVVAIYNNYYLIMRFVFLLLTSTENAIIPSVGNSIVMESKEKNRRNFYMINFIYVWLLTVCISCFCSGVQAFVKLWVGEQMLLSNGILFLLLIYCYVSKMGSIISVYKEAAGIWTDGQYIPLISAIINLTLNIILTKQFGIAGVLISSIVSMATVNYWGYVYVVFQKYLGSFNEMAVYLFKQYMYEIVNVFLIAVVWMVTNKICLGGILDIICRIAIAFLMQNIMMIILYHKSESFKLAIDFLK